MANSDLAAMRSERESLFARIAPGKSGVVDLRSRLKALTQAIIRAELEKENGNG